jgi:hypothetical protein
MHLSSPMTLKITNGSDGQRTTLRLSGRIRSADVEDIREAMKAKAERIVLDLEEVTLVDKERSLTMDHSSPAYHQTNVPQAQLHVMCS